MIRLNKITEYSIRIMRAMYRSNGEIISSVRISEIEAIPLPMMMKVLRKLKHVGMIRSSRGRGDSCGGYALAIDPQSLTLLDVVTRIEGEITVSSCLSSHTACCKGTPCEVRNEMVRINAAIKNELSQKTLLEMIS